MGKTTSPDYAARLQGTGLQDVGKVFWNPTSDFLIEEAIVRGEAKVARGGPLVVETGKYTGRSPNDRFIVKDSVTDDSVDWGKVNVPVDEDVFDRLLAKMQEYAKGRDLFVQDAFVGADSDYTMPIRVITEKAWHNLFARNMFRPTDEPGYAHPEPGFTVFQMPGCLADGKADGVNSEAFVIISFKKKMVIIGGSWYGGEIKKSIFSVMNYILPNKDVLPMHCSANVGSDGSSALFFGLSGTGKTTLSADKSRGLIGDDEHGWSGNGIFNLEGGCYAKVINLSAEAEPEIHETTHSYGTILENVVMDEDSREVDLFDGSKTENTRASYPLQSIPNIVPNSTGPHPNAVMFLTADAFGVLPPISLLNREQAMYHFISGYTAKLAGTERGVTEPKATFSALFGAPFMPLAPAKYAEMLGQRLDTYHAKVWLVNTGWTGGAFGEGHRMEIKYTRAMVNAALDGSLDDAEFEQEPVFGLSIPKQVAGVPEEVLNPRKTWKDKEAYDKKAEELARLFHENFKQFVDSSPHDLAAAGPLLGR